MNEIQKRLMREPFIRPVPKNPARHIYHVHRQVRELLIKYRPSSRILFESTPGECITAHVQWLSDPQQPGLGEGRAFAEESASYVKRQDKESVHVKYMEQSIKKRIDLWTRVVEFYRGGDNEGK